MRRPVVFFTALLCFGSALLLTGAAPAPPLPPRVLVGYWQNWVPPRLRLADVPPEYDVIDVAFALPTTAGGATMRFVPEPSLYATPQQFAAEVQALQAQGRKVLISIGGGGTLVYVQSAANQQAFVTSMLQIIATYGFDGLDIDLEGDSLWLAPGDDDFRAPTSPRIVYFIAALQQLLSQLSPSFMLTAAPETANVQGGQGMYGGVWGSYLPVLHALRNRLTFVHVQHYNSGTMYGRNGAIYTSGTLDFHVAMADALLAGFPVDRFGQNLWFPPLSPRQVAIGLPASPSAAGSGFTPPPIVHAALDYIYLGISGTSTYPLSRAQGYPGMRGLMTWSIQEDQRNARQFALSHRPYLNGVFRRFDRPWFELWSKLFNG